jgi:hypothetical protein
MFGVMVGEWLCCIAMYEINQDETSSGHNRVCSHDAKPGTHTFGNPGIMCNYSLRRN